MRRTMLFLPSNNPNMLINGGQLGADSLIFDLEDAVSPDEKDAARELLKNTLESLDFGKCERIVRINGLDTDYWMEDLRAILPLRPETIMPPKVSGLHPPAGRGADCAGSRTGNPLWLHQNPCAAGNRSRH